MRYLSLLIIFSICLSSCSKFDIEITKRRYNTGYEITSGFVHHSPSINRPVHSSKHKIIDHNLPKMEVDFKTLNLPNSISSDSAQKREIFHIDSYTKHEVKSKEENKRVFVLPSDSLKTVPQKPPEFNLWAVVAFSSSLTMIGAITVGVYGIAFAFFVPTVFCYLMAGPEFRKNPKLKGRFFSIFSLIVWVGSILGLLIALFLFLLAVFSMR